MALGRGRLGPLLMHLHHLPASWGRREEALAQAKLLHKHSLTQGCCPLISRLRAFPLLSFSPKRKSKTPPFFSNKAEQMLWGQMWP